MVRLLDMYYVQVALRLFRQEWHVCNLESMNLSKVNTLMLTRVAYAAHSMWLCK